MFGSTIKALGSRFSHILSDQPLYRYNTRGKITVPLKVGIYIFGKQMEDKSFYID
jgi:hypothetical protein